MKKKHNWFMKHWIIYSVILLFLFLFIIYPISLIILYPENYKDIDNDGLSKTKEERIGTNFTNPDTDGDGILDGDDKDPLDNKIAISISKMKAEQEQAEILQKQKEDNLENTEKEREELAKSYLDGGFLIFDPMRVSVNECKRTCKETLRIGFNLETIHQLPRGQKDNCDNMCEELDYMGGERAVKTATGTYYEKAFKYNGLNSSEDISICDYYGEDVKKICLEVINNPVPN